MKRLLILLLVVLISPFYAWPQEKQPSRIKGLLKDKDTQQPLTDASIALLHERDSSRVALTFTDRQGNFLIVGIPEGNYRLHISYLGYQSLSRTVQITVGNKVADLEVILIQKTGLTLATVEIVETRPSVTVKKDTLEFNADYFKTRENAIMEDLLKKLPGIKIARDGTIKVQGQTVKRVLIDGQPFFGDDPKMATRNLSAEIIDKIQLIDSKSEQAQFSGINNGKTEKIINITIKKNHKRDFSGRATAGYGTEDRFAVNGNTNRFRDEQHLSFLGSGNNVNGYQDGGSTGNADRSGNGIIRNWNAGFNYNENFGKGLRLSGSYAINNNRTEDQRNSARQNVLPDTTWYYDQQGHSIENNTEHRLFLRMDYKMDTLHTLIAAVSFTHSSYNNLREQLYESLGGNRRLLNSGTMGNLSTGSTPKLSAAVSFGNKFKRAGRSFGVQLGMDYNHEGEKRFNSSHNLFALPGGRTFTDSLDQHNDISGDYRHITVYLIYTEPLFKGNLLDLTYGYIQDNNLSDRFTYDYNFNKKVYDSLNDGLSNSFTNVVTTQQVFIAVRKQSVKYEYSLGGYLQISRLDNTNRNLHSRFLRSTTNVLPAIRFDYAFTNNNHLRYLYYGNIEQPSIMQLQPIPDNRNPLYIQLGNPDLKPAYVHNHNLGYNAFNPITLHSFNMDIRTAITTNKIVNANWFDSLGRQVSRPLNMNGTYSINTEITNSFPLKKQHTTINANTTLIYNRDVSSMNGVKGNTSGFTINQGLSLNYTYKELFDFATEAGIHYNRVRYSLQEDNNINYFNYTFSFDGNINLPLGITIGGRLDYWLNTGRAAGYNLAGTLLNAFISKSVFKHSQGLIKLQGFDLLNQNVSISRNVGQNYIEDVQSSVLQRFFMVSFSYFLKKAGGNDKGVPKK